MMGLFPIYKDLGILGVYIELADPPPNLWQNPYSRKDRNDNASLDP